ncbi:GL10870 [Drosophila persimilis]|uniref:GL10870 n=1 Tax=Drosophila persimilis TaxID=7234 RepID=B4GDD2_DROPE|nr:GL10870 [Drosophila persimilis]
MQMKQFSRLLKLRSVYRQARSMARLPDPPCESVLCCSTPQRQFPYQLPYEKLMAVYRELETKCSVLREALHQTGNKWQTQRPGPKPPSPEKCRYHQWTTVECPPGKLRMKKIQPPGYRATLKESHHLFTIETKKTPKIVMAGTSILASICAGRLTKFFVNQSKSQSHLIRSKAQWTAQVLSPQPKAAERFDYLRPYAASHQIPASRRMAKAMNYDFTSTWTSFISGCQRSPMKKQPNDFSPTLPKGASGDKMLPVPATVPVLGEMAPKLQTLRMFELLEASRKGLSLFKAPPTPKLPLHLGKMSGGMAQMSPTLLMGRQYAMGRGLGSCVNNQSL